MSDKQGVAFLLAKGTRIPKWLCLREDTRMTEAKIQGRPVRILAIEGFLAFFDLEEGVILMPPNYRAFQAFRLTDVLEIRDLTGRLIERNPYLCFRCFQNTGTIDSEIERPGGRVDIFFRCSVCENKWKVPNLRKTRTAQTKSS